MPFEVRWLGGQQKRKQTPIFVVCDKLYHVPGGYHS